MNEPMTVVMVPDKHGAHPEPPLDDRWDDLTKLRWNAALIEHQTGIRVVVSTGGHQTLRHGAWVDEPGRYSLQVGGSSISSFDFRGAWDVMIGVELGAQAAARR